VTAQQRQAAVSRHRLVKVGSAVLVVVLLGTQCSSATLPPPLLPEQREAVELMRFPITVGVARYRFPVYSEHLAEDLRSTGMFQRVAPLEEVPDADLVAEVTETVYGTATIPIITALTFGLVPTTVDEDWGDVFRLRRPEGEDGVDVDFRYSGPSTLGWWGIVENRKRDRTWRPPRSTRRFHDALAYEIAVKADEIRRLLTD